MYENDFDYFGFDYLAGKARALLLSAEHDGNQLVAILTEDYPSTMPLPQMAGNWLDSTYDRCKEAVKAAKEAHEAMGSWTGRNGKIYDELIYPLGNGVLDVEDKLVRIARQHGYKIAR